MNHAPHSGLYYGSYKFGVFCSMTVVWPLICKTWSKEHRNPRSDLDPYVSQLTTTQIQHVQYHSKKQNPKAVNKKWWQGFATRMGAPWKIKPLIKCYWNCHFQPPIRSMIQPDLQSPVSIHMPEPPKCSLSKTNTASSVLHFASHKRWVQTKFTLHKPGTMYLQGRGGNLLFVAASS